ncbi:hypothetical protein GCM10011371_17920 [Novosphingobium marinum]|nr:hypothetical protein GCM10011371_17920 [Novosphingobium marinum]
MPRYGVPQERKGRETGTPRHGLTQGFVPCSSFSMMAAVMRWAGEAEAARRDLVMGGLLIAGTGISRFRKSKAPSSLFLLRATSHAPDLPSDTGSYGKQSLKNRSPRLAHSLAIG